MKIKLKKKLFKEPIKFYYSKIKNKIIFDFKTTKFYYFKIKNKIIFYFKNQNNKNKFLLLETLKEILPLENNLYTKVNILKKIIKLDSSNFDNFKQLGKIYYSISCNKDNNWKKNLLNSKKWYSKALKINKNYDLRFELFRTLKDLSNFKENDLDFKVEIYKQMIDLDIDSNESYKKLGKIFEEKYKFKQLEHIKKIKKFNEKQNKIIQSSLKYKENFPKIDFDEIENQSFSTINSNIFNQIFKGFLLPTVLIGKGLLLDVIKSPLFWIVCLILPFLTILLTFLMVPHREILPDDFPYFLRSKFLYNVLNYCIITPMIILTMVIFPRYLVKSRENNFFKRIITNGVSRIQIFLVYVLVCSFILLFWILWMMIPFLLIVQSIAEDILKSSTYSVDRILKHSSDFFLPMLFLSFIAIITWSYKKGMNAHSSGKVTSIGLGLWIFFSISGSMYTMFNETILTFIAKANESEFSDGKKYLLLFISFIFKFMFLLHPISIINMALTVLFINYTMKDYIEFININIELPGIIFNMFKVFYSENWPIFYLTMLLSSFWSLFTIFSIFFKNKKITNFEIGR